MGFGLWRSSIWESDKKRVDVAEKALDDGSKFRALPQF